LDFETVKRILKVMRKINQKERITYILVTHNSVISNMADRIIYLKDGKIDRIVENEEPLDADELKW